MAQRYSEFMTQPQIPGTGPTIQDFFSDRLFGDIRSGQPELGIYNTPQMQYLAEDDLESQNAGQFVPEEEKGIFSLSDILADLGRKGVEGFKDIAGRGIGFNVGTNAGYMLGGIPVALAGGIFGALKGGDMFNSPYIGAGAATVDEYGNIYSAEQLDQMNARGGYYTDPARASRRRDKSIERFRARNAEIKGRYANLLAQQAKENTAKQSAFDKLNAIRQQNDSDSMSGGPGETTSGTFGSSVNDSSTFSDYS